MPIEATFAPEVHLPVSKAALKHTFLGTLPCRAACTRRPIGEEQAVAGANIPKAWMTTVGHCCCQLTKYGKGARTSLNGRIGQSAPSNLNLEPHWETPLSRLQSPASISVGTACKSPPSIRPPAPLTALCHVHR